MVSVVARYSASLAVIVGLALLAVVMGQADQGLQRFLWIVTGAVVVLTLYSILIWPFLRPWWDRMSLKQHEAIVGWLFVAPWVVGFLAFGLGPMVFSLFVSFTKYNIIGTPHWIGLQNYQFIFQHDPQFPVSLYNTIWLVVVKTPFVMVGSLVLALLLNQKIPGQRLFRTIYYMPVVVTGVAAIFLWVWVLYPRGILNQALAFLHLPTPLWFFDPSWTKPAMVVMGMWYIGGGMLLLLAALTGIPKHLYEAADVEGAGPWRKFRSITIPMLSPTLFYMLLTNIIGGFQVFNSAYVISTSSGVGTNPGDPQQSLLFYELVIFEHFRDFDMGYASALAWILFVIILAITLLQLWLGKKWVYYEGG